MIIPFDEVRREALLALYRLMYSSDAQEYFTRVDISQEARIPVGVVFFGRALKELVNQETVERSFHEDGDEFYTLTNSGWTEAEKIALNMMGGGEAVEGVPASDRVVSLSDNQRDGVGQAVDQIVDEIRSSNEVSIALGDDKQRLEAELEAGKRLAVPNRARLGAIISVLATPLRYLAEKFSGGLVGELAKKLLDLLWTVING